MPSVSLPYRPPGIMDMSERAKRRKACEYVMIGFGFIFDWSRKNMARDSHNNNNIVFRIKVLRIMKLITKHESLRYSNKFSVNKHKQYAYAYCHKQCMDTRRENLEVKTRT